MALKKPIVIREWNRGMTISPFTGFPQMRGLDPHKVPGTIALNRAFSAVSGSTITAINWMVADSSGIVYFLTNDGKLWKTSDFSSYSQVTGNTTTSASGNGLAYWNDYIIVVRDQAIDAYNISTTTWTSNFATLANSQTAKNPAFTSHDGKIYFGNGKNVATLAETTGSTFDPATGATFTFDDDALILPSDYVITCFEDSLEKIVIGTNFGTSAFNSKIADCFIWNRDSTQSFSSVIHLADEGVNAMIRDNNNRIFISSGKHGKISVSNGVSVSAVTNIPLDTREFPGQSGSTGSSWGIFVYPDALEFFGDELLIGASQTNAAGAAINPLGLFGYLNGAIRYMGDQTSGKDGSDGSQVEITSVYSVSPVEYLVAWKYTLSTVSTHGLDYVNLGKNRISSYGGYFHSTLYQIGTARSPETVEHFDIYFVDPLASGDGLQLSYRGDNSSSFTSLKTVDYATFGAITAFSFDHSLPNLTNLQLKVALTATGKTSPVLAMIVVS